MPISPSGTFMGSGDPDSSAHACTFETHGGHYSSWGACDTMASLWDRLPKPTASYGNALGCENSTASSPARPLRDRVPCVPCCQAQVSAGAASTALEPHSPQKASGLVSHLSWGLAAGVSMDIGRENIWNWREYLHMCGMYICTCVHTQLGQGP